VSITNDSVSFLGESLQRIGTKFRSSLEVMMLCSECPTVFVDAETVRISYVLKYLAAELFLYNLQNDVLTLANQQRSGRFSKV